MGQGRMKLTIIMLIMAVLVLPLVSAQEPPSLDNHQFYGVVKWDENRSVPAEVVVKVGGDESASSIGTHTCENGVCTANYGYDEIIRVQAVDGETVAFFVDGIKYNKTAVYSTGSSTSFPLDFSTTPCLPDWDCDECVDGKKNCTDENYCSANNTEARECAEPSGGVKKKEEEITLPKSCVYIWDCVPWSACINSKKTQTCARADDCDVRLAAGEVDTIIDTPKPAETASCFSFEEETSLEDYFVPSAPKFEASCDDGIRNQDEEEVDCGGVCTPCGKEGSGILIYIIILAVVALAGAGALIYYLRKRGKLDLGVEEELSSAYERGEEKGMSREQVTKALIDRGWDPQVLNKYK